MGKVALVGSRTNRTTVHLAEAWYDLGLDARVVPGREAFALDPDDVAVGRLDVLPTLDGVEPGLVGLLLLERRGVPVRNTAAALLAAHDKLRTARLLEAAGLPVPRTRWLRAPDDPLPLPVPVVVKPRFGSWGADVCRCSTEEEARAVLRSLSDRSWFRRHGALLQELVPSAGTDLRVLVAGGRAVGGAERAAAVGEWRTNVTLGGRKTHADPGPQASALAIAAARALTCDLAAVDLLPVRGDFVVLELNAAADFDEDYAPPGRDVYLDVARALDLPGAASASGAPRRAVGARARAS